jgi:integrase
MLAAAGPQLKAMILLGINCGFGNTDISTLPLDVLDLDGSWIDFPRPKTAVPRRVSLWPETVAAIREALKVRPVSSDPAHARLVFVTRFGVPWVRVELGNGQENAEADIKAPLDVSKNDAIVKQMRRLQDAIGLKRKGLNFYAFRHCFETVAGESRDQVAVDAVMGHTADADDMAAAYRERISGERLRAVAEYVRRWLFDGPIEPRIFPLEQAGTGTNG